MVSGAAVGAATGAVSHRVSTGSWDGAGEAALNGMGDGALSGAITGAVSGAASGAVSKAKTIGNKVTKPKVKPNTGAPFKGVGSSQIGVDPNTLTLNPNFVKNPVKYKAAFKQITENGMYGVIDVSRSGLVYNGQHRVLIARELGLAVDVVIR